MATYASNPTRGPLAPFLSTWTAPDGWVHRRYDRPHEPGTARRGRFAVQTGRADMIEKYGDAIDHFRAQGWDVTAFDWRGQGGSGRLTGDGTGHIDRLERLGEDLTAFYAGWVRPDEGPACRAGPFDGRVRNPLALAGGGSRPMRWCWSRRCWHCARRVGQWAGARFARWQVGRGDPMRPPGDGWRRPPPRRRGRNG